MKYRILYRNAAFWPQYRRWYHVFGWRYFQELNQGKPYHPFLDFVAPKLCNTFDEAMAFLREKREQEIRGSWTVFIEQ